MKNILILLLILLTSYRVQSQDLVVIDHDIQIFLGESIKFKLQKRNGLNIPTAFEAANLPSGAELNPKTGQFTWTPTQDNLGRTGIIMYLVDSASRILDEEFVNIEVTKKNQAPDVRIESVIINGENQKFNGSINISEKDKLQISARIIDEDPEKVFFTYYFNGDINVRELDNASIFYNTASHQFDFKYEPNETQARKGHIEWNLKLIDKYGEENGFNLRINITNIDFPPAILNKPSKKSIKDEFTFEYSPIVSNEDNDALKFSYKPDKNIQNINMDDNTGKITWDIKSGVMVEGQEYSIYLKVEELDQPEHFDEVNLEFIWSATNKAPIIKAIPGWNVKEGIENFYQIIAEDPNLDDELTYQFAGGSSIDGMEIDPKTGVLSFTPKYSMVPKANGTMDLQIGIKVIDSKGMDAIGQVPIKVFDRPDPNRLSETYEHLNDEMGLMLSRTQEIRDQMIFLDGRLKSQRRTTTIILSAITLAGAIFSGLPDESFLRKASPGIVGIPAAYSLILAIDIKDEELITTLKQKAADLSTILDHKIKRLELYENIEKEQLSNDPEFITLINQYNDDNALRDQATRLNELKTGFSTISNIKKYQKILRRYDSKKRKKSGARYFKKDK